MSKRTPVPPANAPGTNAYSGLHPDAPPVHTAYFDIDPEVARKHQEAQSRETARVLAEMEAKSQRDRAHHQEMMAAIQRDPRSVTMVNGKMQYKEGYGPSPVTAPVAAGVSAGQTTKQAASEVVAATTNPAAAAQRVRDNVPIGRGSGPDPSPSGTPGTVSDAQVYAIADALAEDGDTYIPNPLNEFEQIAYNFKLVMVSDSDFLTSTKNSEDAIAAYDDLPKVILAETGVTAGFNIKDVRFKLISPMAGQKDTMEESFNISIVETLGTSFLDLMRKAAIKLRIKNVRSCPYFLELTFKGYDENGNIIPNLLENNPDYPDGGRWIYAIQIRNIQTTFDVGGSEYHIEALPFNLETTESELSMISDMMVIKGKTIGEMLDSLAQSLEEAQLYRHFVKLRTYKFVCHPVEGLDGEDPTTYPVTLREKDLADTSTYTMGEDGIPTIHLSSGSVSNAVQMIFSLAPKVQQLAKGVNKEDEIDDPVSKVKESLTFNIEPQLAHSGYEQYTGQYITEATYYIHAYRTERPILSRQQVIDASTPDVQGAIIDKWRQSGYLKKRYDYYHTGKNTEVINIDTKFNFTWAAVLPQTYGMNNTIESNSTFARVNENIADNRGYVQENNRLRSKIRQLELKQGELDKQLEEARASGDQQAIKRADEAAAANSNERTQTYQEIARTARLFAANKGGGEQSDLFDNGMAPGTVFYADELEELDEEDNMFMVTFAQQEIVGMLGAPKPYYRDRGIYSAILDQLYAKEMREIDLEIRGDPHWLGQGDLHRTNINRSENGRASIPGMADYYTGDNLFLFNMRYPFTLDDEGGVVLRQDENGAPKDGFTGFYFPKRVDNIFEGGTFRQIIHAGRFQLIDFANRVGVNSENQDFYNQQVDGAGGGSSSTARGPLNSARSSGQNLSTKDILPNATDEDMITRTVYGECRNCSPEEQRAIAHVIRNRMEIKGKSARDIVLQDKQFSPWNATAAQTGQRDKLINLDPNSKEYRDIQNNIRGVLNGTDPDPTKGADHFYTGRTPDWAHGKSTLRIPGFHHVFQNHNGAFPG